ncbi:Porphobilinogen deaminase [Novipirellula galeiformis]|uniref:Porphobilinogen deaminase n=1 Tax=Novipirellula galeiformis TaxID=2528004 RepID=A0A5C6CKV4_9BACT|nr:Porphobilinogen deaminase [Novipirellula galeiformis]
MLRIATRESPLAMWQAEHVSALLKQAGFATKLVPLVSSGDTDMRPIQAGAQVGVFTKRIQQALLDGEADVAVHSLKDLPTEVDPQLMLAAVPAREVVQDCLVSQSRWTIATLPKGARIGTGSRRRAAQLRYHRPDLDVQPIRGNVQTRLEKLRVGQYDAIMLAAAGLTRLQMDEVPRVELPLAEMLPAPGQGALAIEVRRDAEEVQAIVAGLNDLVARATVMVERTLLAALNGGCLAPIAAYCQIEQGVLTLDAVVLSSDGTQRLDERRSLPFDPPQWEACAKTLADQASESLASRGARELIQETRS